MLKTNKITFIAVLAFVLSGSGLFAQNKLADTQFAKDMCNAWNSSKLPKILGDKSSGGNNWINVVTGYNVPVKQPAGYQKIVSGRKDCKGWPKFEMVIEKQADGSAKCTSAGPYSGSKVTWQFLPATDKWFKYARSFGYIAFMQLWNNGMVGDMFEGKRNQDNFAIFFNFAGKIALKTDYISGCNGIDKEDVEEEVADLKKAWKM